ncbi:MMPL family transporter [Janibacter sp. DB-40]|uniref:MMPL family transporter n=1 Tax=Janibacter sp. DB-40 TaxID=3028808 RepID=UPI0024067D6F|nr:MMPL family transporter [Janibacter sp. DB-40]
MVAAAGTRWRARLLAGVLLLVWLAVAGVGGPLVGQLTSVQNNDQASFLPDDAESTQVAARLGEFGADTTLPLLLVVEDESGVDRATIGELQGWATQLPQQSIEDVPGTVGDYLAESQVPVIPAEDGEAVLVPLTLDAAEAEQTVDETAISTLIVEALRADLAPDVDAQVAVTGPAGFAADLGEAFAGIDGILLLVALVVVLIILVVVYRSPILPFVVLTTSIFGLAFAALIIYPMADAGWIQLSGQSQGILFILVVGAATDYSLLLVARYREELHRSDPLAALRVAWRQTFGPVAASGLTVIAGLLCLLLSDLGNISSLGPIGALGIVGAMVAALTLLPAALALLGRAAFWPSIPKQGDEPRHRLWSGVADRVTRRPRRTWIVTAAALLVAAGAATTFNASGITQAEFFTTDVESVQGQEIVDEHFGGGDQRPVQVIVPESGAAEAKGVLADHPQVADRAEEMPSQEGSGDVLLSAPLTVGSESDEAGETVRELRDQLDPVSADAVVGGAAATTVDTDDASQRDYVVVIPAILLVVTLILIGLLRSVAAALMLVAVNVLSFAATLGVAAVLFNHVLDYPGADPSTPVLAFVFLVALAVDYSIFLMTRAREEALAVGTRRGIPRAVAVTGGVITSAGVVLAATFSALWVIPLLFLAQIAFVVAFGVLLDTIVTRSILVPAIVADVGNRIWWPGDGRMTSDDEAPRTGRAGRHRAGVR